MYKSKVLSFGTYVDVTLYDVEESRAKQIIQRVEEQLNLMHEQWHAWRPSAITDLNEKLQTGEPFTLDADMLPLIEQSKSLYSSSNGYFNPAIGKLIELWGFYKDVPQGNSTIPTKEAINQYIANLPTMDHVHLDERSVYGSNPQIQLDFGGYAKGYGVEQLIYYLQSNGIENALINAGGDVKGIGSVGDRPWTIALKHPQTEVPVASMELQHNESIFSSGSYIRYFEVDGVRYHHILNPKTGYPSDGAKATTVVTENAAVADAAATALMIAPANEWLDIARQMNLKHFLIIDESGELFCDELFAKRLQLILSDKTLTIVGTINQN